MKRLSDYMIISDVDGTLIDENGVPARNIEAIRRFVGKGGRFGIATGRSRGTMREATRQVPVNAPCVLYNGGALYDYQEDRILWEQFLPDTAEGYVRELMAEAPYTGIVVIQNDMYHRIREVSGFEGYFEARRRETSDVTTLEDIPKPWYKALFQVHPEDFDRFLTLARSKEYSGVKFIGSYITLAEMLPERSGKGTALAKLVELGGVERENIVAIGDFYNDLDMIEYAGIGVAVANAPEDIRQRADLVVGDCGSGAVADVIEYIERLTAQ